jgi:hypothetical protein
MAGSIFITLAGKPYKISQLTLGQLRSLSIGVSTPDTNVNDPVGASFDRSVNIIVTALKAAHPDLTSERLFEMPISTVEMREAVSAILTFAGLLPQEAKPGEADAGAGSSTGLG